MQCTTRVVLTFATVVLTVRLSAVSAAQELTAVEAQAIAREAYVYGFPIVESYRAIYASAIDSDGKEYKAPFNKLKHDDVVPGPHDESVVTPNVDTLFSYLSIDLRREPVVLGVPEFKAGDTTPSS